MATVSISNRSYLITALSDGNILDMGPATSGSTPGTWIIQFNPSVDFSGSIVILGRVFGPAAAAANIPMMPVPYRRVTINNVASDYAMVIDQIATPSIIQVPSNALAIGLAVTCSAGSCMVVSWDLNGPSSV